jgi:hypothetical protein
MALRFLLVDEYWTHVGWFESQMPDWSVGQQLVSSEGRPLAIVAIVPNPDAEADYVAIWTVEAA